MVFSSAGTHATGGEPINPDMVAVLPPELDTSEFRSRRLTTALLEDADLVVTMEAAHRTFVLDDHPGMFRKVFTLGQLAKALEQAPEGLDRDGLLAHLGSTRRNAIPHSTCRTPIVGGQRPPQGAWRASTSCCAPCCPLCPADAPAQEDERSAWTC